MKLKQRWQQLSMREQSRLSGLALILAAGLVWQLAIAPAWQAIQNAQAQQLRLAEQLNDMQNLKAQVAVLRQQTPLSKDDAWRVLQGLSAKGEGHFSISLQGDKVLLQVKNAPPQALASWLSHARTQAQSTPDQAHLSQSDGNWSGQLIMRLPHQP
jgi:general secretion pathway protein M